jgi:hypothetical protein
MVFDTDNMVSAKETIYGFLAQIQTPGEFKTGQRNN